MHHTFIRHRIMLAMTIFLVPFAAIAQPLVTIIPQDYTYHDKAVARGTQLTVPYTITNNTPATLYNVTSTGLPKGVSSSVCAVLSAGSSCTLNLTIPATLTEQRVVRSRFKVCVRENAGCTSVSAENQLDITIVDNNTFIAITDTHLNISNRSNITYGEDTGYYLWKSVKKELNTLINTQAPKFIVLLGDLPKHKDLPQLEFNIGTVLRSFSTLRSISENNIPVFYAFGNNDSLVNNYGPYYDGVHNLFYLDPKHSSPAKKGWPALNANSDCSVSPTHACTYTTTSPMPLEHAADMANVTTGGGYYSAYPLGSKVPIRLISLNSVIFSRNYLSYAYDPVTQLTEAQTEMNWLSNQLASAAKNKESVYIIMHIPVGNDAFFNGGGEMWNDTLYIINIPFHNDHLLFRDAFLALTSLYKKNIRAVLSGHTHEDELRALYPDRITENMYVLDVGVPAITPNHFSNPAMKVYLYNKTFRLTEAKTYYTTPVPSGWVTYSFKDDYNCKKYSSIFSCVAARILPQLPYWKLQPQPIPGNPYELDYSVRKPNDSPSPFSTWLTILDAIQVVPIQ